MKIAINILGARLGGAITYLKNILPLFAEMDRVNEYFILYSKEQEKLLFDAPANFHWIEFQSLSRFPSARPILEQLLVPIFIWKNKIDILLSTSDTTCFLASCKVVLTMHNLAIYMPLERKINNMLRLRFFILRQLAKCSARKAKSIIFVSNTSRYIISQRMKIPLEKTRVVYHGIDDIFLRENAQGSELNGIHIRDASYILFVSNLGKNKNLIGLVKAFSLLYNKLKARYHLVIAGEIWAKDDFAVAQEIIQKEKIEEYVHFLGRVEYTKLPTLYRNAMLFVFPSYSETFGLPLVEAMASGLPIVASNAPSCPEICQDAAVYFNPADVEEMGSAMHTVLSDEGLQKNLRERGLERAKNFSWKKSASETLAILEE